MDPCLPGTSSAGGCNLVDVDGDGGGGGLESGCSDYESCSGSDSDSVVYAMQTKTEKEKILFKRNRDIGHKWDETDFAEMLPFWDKLKWTEWPPPEFKETPFLPTPQNVPIGPTKDFSNATILDIFGELMGPTLELVRCNTNKYGEVDVVDWHSITSKEMLCFVGILLQMAINKKKDIESYWGRKDGDPKIAKFKMSCRRFLMIFKHIRLYDPDKEKALGHSIRSNKEQYDSLHKIRKAWTVTMESFQRAYNPGRNISLDETMSKFLGSLAITQVLRRKPDPVGLKIDSVCDINGYYLNGEVHSGEPIKYDIHRGRIISTVYHLLGGHNFENSKSYLHENRIIYTDRGYTSPALAVGLMKHKTFLIGTCKGTVTGAVPHDIMKGAPLVEGFQKGEIVWRFANNGMSMVAWKDARVVNVLSSFPATDRGVHVVKRNAKRTQRGQSIWNNCTYVRPNLIGQFSDNMAGVDIFGRRRKSRQRHMKTRRWYVGCVFSFLIDTAAVNTAIIYQKSKPQSGFQNWKCKEVLVEELLELIDEKVEAVISLQNRRQKLNPECRSVESVKRFRRHWTKGHFPKLMDCDRRLPCVAHLRQKRSRYICDWCQVVLCPECFRSFHCDQFYIVDDIPVGPIVNSTQLY